MSTENAKQIIRCFQKYDPDCFEAVKVVEKPKLVDILFRVQPKQEPAFLELVEKTLYAIDELAGGRCLIGRLYFLKEYDDGSKDMVYGWKVSLSHPKLTTLVAKMCKVFGLVIPAIRPQAVNKKRGKKRTIGSGKRNHAGSSKGFVRTEQGIAPDEMPLPSTRRGPGQKGMILGAQEAEYHPATTRL